jgi:hypothetical protein
MGNGRDRFSWKPIVGWRLKPWADTTRAAWQA